MLGYDRIDISEGIDINKIIKQMHQKNATYVIIRISKMVINMNHMVVMI